MRKPVPIDRPAMTLRESENLLRAEDQRISNKEDRKALAIFFWYGLIFCLCIFFIVWGAFDFLMMIGRLLH